MYVNLHISTVNYTFKVSKCKGKGEVVTVSK